MCYFVTLGVPAGQMQVIERLDINGFSIEAVANNAPVARLFPPSDALFTITRGGCSCSFYAEPRPATERDQEAADETRYRRKGWSADKVSRAVDAKRQARAASTAGKDRAQFVGAVLRIVRELGRVRLFAHMYSGPIDTEPFGQIAALRLPLARFNRLNGAFPVDTVVEIVDASG